MWPAVVVGDDLNALGVLRSLGAGGVQAHLLSTRAEAAPARSRHGIKHYCERLSGQPLLAGLDALARSLRGSAAVGDGKPVLLLTEEKSVETVCEHAEELSHAYRLTSHAASTLRLLHKAAFQIDAERAGMPIPKAMRVTSIEQAEALRDFRYPLILKPAARDLAYSRRFRKAYRVEDFEAARALCAEILPVCADLIAQEWIEGDDSDIYFCLVYLGRQGQTVAGFTGRKLRSWPPRVGGTASCTAAPEAHAVLLARTVAFFRQAGFWGMGSMEYKRDPRDGEYYCVEPTVGRTDFQEEVATLHGVNIPLLAYRFEAFGELAPPASYMRSFVWQEGTAQARAEAADPGAGTTAPEGTRVVDACFRWGDPRPAVSLFADRVRRRLSTRRANA